RLKTLFADEWDEEAQKWTVAKERRDARNQPTDMEAYERFTEERVKVSEDNKSGLVTLAIELRDPVVAATWVNDLISLLNQKLRQRAQAEAERNLAYLNEQLLQTRFLEIREALYGLIENESKNAMLANAKADY